MEDDKKDVYGKTGHELESDDDRQAAEKLLHEQSLYTDKQYSRLRLKFSLVIIPMMCFIYGLAFA